MNKQYMTSSEAVALSDSFPAGQVFGLGQRLRYSLMSGMGFKEGQKFYVDGTSGSDTNDGLSWETGFKTIQKAVDSCGNGRGDVIFVGPMPSAKYTENVLINGHQSIKIIAPWGPWATRIRVSDAAVKYPFTPPGGSLSGGAGFIVLSRDVEICGFGIDSGGAYTGIYCGDSTALGGSGANTAGCNFHDNLMIGGTDGLYHFVLQGSSDAVQIKQNIIEGCSGAGLYMCCGGAKTNQRTLIQGNQFVGCMDYGVYLTNDVHYNIMVLNNMFFDRLPGTTVMTRSCLFQGGYGSVFAGNLDATTNGALGASTDFMSGNTELHAMNSPVYIAEV
jgi:hypothetical protein